MPRSDGRRCFAPWRPLTTRGAAPSRRRAVAAEILPAASTTSHPITIPDRLLFGLLHRLAGDYRRAAPLLRSAVADLQDTTIPEDLRLPWMRVGTFAATDLLDDENKTMLAAEYVRLAGVAAH
jgi:hypothetical protein